MENIILDLEKKYWEGMETHNYETVSGLTHFPCIVAGKNGVSSIDETAFKKMFESGAGTQWKNLSISGAEIQAHSNNVAVIAYEIDFENVVGDKNLPLKCACSSTWIKKDDKWLCVMHTECELQK